MYYDLLLLLSYTLILYDSIFDYSHHLPALPIIWGRRGAMRI